MPLPPAPLTPDQSAAHYLLAELRTRITTQPLPYQYGVEAQALKSLWEVFSHVREAIKQNPGCEKFAAEATDMLNIHLRPVTAKWHRAHEDGRLNSKDGADEFRGDLADVQLELRKFTERLYLMLYGSALPDRLTPPAVTPGEIDECFRDLKFGIPLHTRKLKDEVITGINTSEGDEIAKRRKIHGIHTREGHNAVGLALSGGGIRSATFCLGVIQVLSARGLLKDFDFLSTVSGGGYAGSFVTVRWGNGADCSEIAGPHGPDPDPIRYVRHHAKFLNPINLKDGWSMVTATLAGMLLNWSAPLFVIAMASLVACLLAINLGTDIWLPLLRLSAGVTGLALIAYGGLIRGEKKMRSVGSWVLGLSSAVTLLIGGAYLVELGFRAFDTHLKTERGFVTDVTFLGVLTAMIAAGPAIFRFFPLLKNPLVRRIALQVALCAAGMAIPVLMLLLYYLGRHLGTMAPAPSSLVWDFSQYGGLGILACIAVGLGLVAIFVLNVNITSPHRLYRNRLAKTFIQTKPGDEEPVPLTDVNPAMQAPYHIINATLNLPACEEPSLRDRKCAFFIFSKHWTGAATTGYHRTSRWKTNGKPVDLATVMAISGAAASSYMGLGSMPTLTALLTFLNVRLGFWIRRPDKRVLSDSAGFLCLLKEMTGIGMHEKAAWLNLSDGGHIENLGVYELLRRRCKFITCVDGESDTTYTFQGLLTLVRHAQIDYGIRIEPRVDELRPGGERGFGQTHTLLCRIIYPPVNDEPAGIGLLLYIKLSMTGNETELINRYRKMHPEFPHESTADQFFKEEQFEAYRQLGVHAAEGLFSSALMNRLPMPTSVPEWFRRLAANLLAPGH